MQLWKICWFPIGLVAALGCQPIQTAPIANQQAVMLGQQPTFVAPSGQPPLFAPPQNSQGVLPVSPPVSGNAMILPPQVTTPAQVAVANPIFVPVSNQDWTWEQIVDVVDDYFRIERESRVQTVGNVITEGRIDTFPQIGATLPEIHRPDSVGRYNRWESSFQTIRRRGLVRVIPEQSGYLIDLTVYKELEDLPHPENSTAGTAIFRNDNSLTSSVTERVSRTKLSEYWIPLGRDQACEQAMLSEIQARLTGGAANGVILR